MKAAAGGAQLGFSAEARELEAWLMRCHERAMRERSRPSRSDAVWQREFDRIEEVRQLCGAAHVMCLVSAVFDGMVNPTHLLPAKGGGVDAFGTQVVATRAALLVVEEGAGRLKPQIDTSWGALCRHAQHSLGNK